MKKLLLFLFFFCTAIYTSSAQSFTVSKSSVIIAGSPDDNVNFYDKINIKNNTSSNLLMRWVRKEFTGPSQWENSVCDSVECYPKEKDSAVFIIPANGSNYINLHFYPNHTPGYGTVKILVYKISNPAESAELTFTGTTDSATGTFCPSFPATPYLMLYPNPATQLLNIQAVNFTLNKNKIVNLYDATGRNFQVKIKESAAGSANLDITGLPGGLYFIKVLDELNFPYVRTFIKE